ncbi:hypothetical protein CU098_009368, partial [Rhizopus stolonifer]
LGIVRDTPELAANYSAITATYSRESRSNTDTTSLNSISSLTDSSASTSSIYSTKQVKLTLVDKENIRRMYQELDPDKMWKLSTGTVVEKKMEEFALSCCYEHPVHSLIFDTNDKSWASYFTKEEIKEITMYKPKKLDELPDVLNNYIEDLKKLRDVDTLKKKLSEETTCSACEWVRYTVLDYFKLFKYGYLPLSDQTEDDMMRRIWFFIDTVFDASPIHCRGGEKSSKSSSTSKNINRVLSAVEKIKRKMVGRKVDLLFLRQSLEYGCCECGRYDVPTKELHDGGFKMTKVLKDMLYCLYKSAPDVLRHVALPGFLLFETKFTVILCDAPAGHVCRIIRSKTMNLPEEPDEIYNQLFSILTLVYKSRLLMENTRNLVRQVPVTVEFDQMEYNTLPPCYYPDFIKQKRRRNNNEED